jgi:predicted short-subunit dehydrogenase-like oxidoreductase (DUF2520 family)
VSSQASRAIGLIGPGRAGVGLALALAQAGYSVCLHGRKKKVVPPPLTLTVGNGAPAWINTVDTVILTVRDDGIKPLASSLAASGAITAKHVVLHLSGVQGQEALGPLVSTQAALGSFHPLQTIVEPELTPARLKGAWAAVEGMPRAVEAGEQIARDLGMRPFRIATKSKPVYHAGAVFASNYLVVVEAVAQRLLRHAGLSDADAWAALRPLVEGTLENLARHEPREALTGPIMRGDTATILRHLESLALDDQKLYRALGRVALELAQKQGMSEETAGKVAAALATDLPPVMRPSGKTGIRGRQSGDSRRGSAE